MYRSDYRSKLERQRGEGREGEEERGRKRGGRQLSFGVSYWSDNFEISNLIEEW